MTNADSVPGPTPAPKWQPLNARQRRLLGVLVEKAKTTPDAYPLTLNALTTGCNQKSNRDPVMNLTPEELEPILVQLRDLGAVIEVQTAGRGVAKYRHQLYEWLGVDKVELAVMAELLLRGEQTVGELRARVSRMEPVASMEELRPILQALSAKNLLLSLTPEGRGQLVTHNLYKERELVELRARLSTYRPAPETDEEPSGASQPAAKSAAGDALAALRADLETLRAEVAELRAIVQQLV
jgi:hypothetical protein